MSFFQPLHFANPLRACPDAMNNALDWEFVDSQQDSPPAFDWELVQATRFSSSPRFGQANTDNTHVADVETGRISHPRMAPHRVDFPPAKGILKAPRTSCTTTSPTPNKKSLHFNRDLASCAITNTPHFGSGLSRADWYDREKAERKARKRALHDGSVFASVADQGEDGDDDDPVDEDIYMTDVEYDNELDHQHRLARHNKRQLEKSASQVAVFTSVKNRAQRRACGMAKISFPCAW